MSVKICKSFFSADKNKKSIGLKIKLVLLIIYSNDVSEHKIYLILRTTAFCKRCVERVNLVLSHQFQSCISCLINEQLALSYK